MIACVTHRNRRYLRYRRYYYGTTITKLTAIINIIFRKKSNANNKFPSANAKTSSAIVLNSQQLRNDETDGNVHDSSLKGANCTAGTTTMTPKS